MYSVNSLLLLTMLIPLTPSAQNRLSDKVLDNQLHQRWLTCKETEVELVMDPTKLDDRCYRWYSRSYGQQNYSIMSNKDSKMTVNPTRTQWYKCERLLKEDGQCGGPIEEVKYFKIYVAEGPDLSEMFLNGEKIYTRNQGTIGNPETMDEFVEYDLTGGVILYDYSDLDDKDLDHLKVQVHFTSSNGEINVSYTSIPKNGFQFLIDQNMVQIPHVRQDGESKDYTLKIQAEYCGMMSEEIKIKVKRLWIDKFEHKNAPSNFMVVLDLPIEFKAYSTLNHCSNFEYKFVKFWGDPENNKQKEGNDMIIKSETVYSNNGPLKNSDFGSMHGDLLLKCNYSVNGIMHKLNVTNNPVKYVFTIGGKKYTIPAITRYMSEKNQDKVLVFFNKFRIFYPETISRKNKVPNWYYYWARSGRLSAHIQDFNDNNYNINNYQNGTTYWAETEHNYFLPSGIFTNVLVIYDEASIQDNYSPAKGIHCFNSTIFHEYEHVVIRKEQFPSFFYDSNDDKDNDKYNDIWEETNPDAKRYGFKVRSDIIPDVIDKYSEANNSNGWRYEEDRCRSVQKKSYENGDCDDYDNKDWSYSMTTYDQGKNWKKR